IEHDRAGVTADRDVLDPGAVLAGQVDAGLDAEGHAGPQPELVPGYEVRILVPLEADAVARPMEEALAVAFGLDRSARRSIDRRAGHAGPDRAGRGFLGALEDGEEVPESLVRSGRRVTTRDPQGPRDVRPVAAERAA